MATATPIHERPAVSDAKVYHPLDRLRGIIRRYVVIEGVLSTFIFLGMWFALALLLDFVVFKTLTWDWVQDGSWWLRLIALVVALVLLAGILVFRIARRLTTEFSYPALALVLERRFPKVLGDRLITAVEMADVDQAERYGYSADMIRQTITEAREKIGQVEVNEVFNWRRLRMLALAAVGIPLAIVAIAFASHAISTRSVDPIRAGWKFFHVSTIVGERDLLLWDTPWPRRALLELQDEAKNGLRVARDGAAPRIRVKSYQWVIADRTKPDGWRPIMWSEVNEKLVGMPVPTVPFRSLGYQNELTIRSTALAAVSSLAAMETAPDENPNFSTSAADWTLDSIYERARYSKKTESTDKEPPQIARLKARMNETEFQQLQRVFEKLDSLANDPSYGRKLRKLNAPESVSFSYTGVKTAGSGTFNPEGNGEYAGEITGLKEDVRFVVKAEDYRTRPQSITLIPPPTLTKLAQISFQPAYMHHAAPQGQGYAALRGLRQQMPEERLSLTGDKSVFGVPSGTEVVLTGVAEKPIAGAWLVPKIGRVPGAKVGSAARVPLRIADRSSEHGSRPLMWSEVNEALLGVPVPEFNPQAFVVSGEAASRSDAAGWTADEVVKLIRDKEPTVRKNLTDQTGEERFKQLQGALAALDEKAKDDSGKYVLRAGTTFSIDFRGDARLRSVTEFDIGFENIDKVSSSRQVLIQVTEDQGPGVEIASDVIRRVGNIFYVTPKAKIPFVAESYVKDENGLSKVEYTYTLYPEDSDIARSMRAALVTRAIIPPVAARLPAVLQGVYHAGAHATLDRGDTRTTGSFLQGGFLFEERKLKRETMAHLERILAEPLAGEKIDLVKRYTLKWDLKADRTFRPNGALESFKWNVEGDYFDLDALKLEVPSGDIQPRFRIDLNLQGTDTNFDTGPKTAASVEPIKLLIVSSGDLLVEIGREEEALGLKLDEALAKLGAAKSKYSFVNSKHLTRKLDELDAVKVRSKEVGQDIVKAREIVLNVARSYRKIERETVINVLDERTIAQYGKLANRLDRVLGENPSAVSADEDSEIHTGKSDTVPFGLLTPEATFPVAEKILTTVQNALDASPGRYAEPVEATDADMAINALEREVQKIRRIIGEAQSKDRLIKYARAIIERQERLGKEIQDLQAEHEGRFRSKEPLINPVGQQFLAKGESKKLRHVIQWLQFDKDDLVVKVSASDASIVVPAELKLNFEKHPNEFEYEIRAGNKEGDYTITLTPEVGKKVEVKVQVK